MDGTHTGKLSVESVRAALRRVRGSALNFVEKGAAAPSASSGRSSEGAAGAALRFSQAPTVARRENRLSAREPGGRNFCPAQQAEMGSPWSVSLLRHAEPLPCRQGLFAFGQAAEIWRKKSGENYCIHRADLLQ